MPAADLPVNTADFAVVRGDDGVVVFTHTLVATVEPFFDPLDAFASLGDWTATAQNGSGTPLDLTITVTTDETDTLIVIEADAAFTEAVVSGARWDAQFESTTPGAGQPAVLTVLRGRVTVLEDVTPVSA